MKENQLFLRALNRRDEQRSMDKGNEGKRNSIREQDSWQK